MTQQQTQEKSGKLVPLRPGLFEMPDSIDGTPKLYGKRCTACQEVYASTRYVYCPNCSSDQLEQMTFEGTGKVLSYTTIHQQLRGALVQAPYTMAQVRLKEGVGIRTVLADIAPEDVKIDMPVEICLRALKEDEHGDTIVNFFFRPARS